MNIDKMEHLRKITEEMDRALIECAKDYSESKDRWAMGGMHQLSVFSLQLKQLL